MPQRKCTARSSKKPQSADPPQRLDQTIGRFLQTIEAATLAHPDGRLIPDHAGASLIAAAASRLHARLVAHRHIYVQKLGTPKPLPDVWIESSSSPNGPWTRRPAMGFEIPVNPSTPELALLTAVCRACDVTAEDQSVNRYRAGWVLPADDLEILRSAQRLAELETTPALRSPGPAKIVRAFPRSASNGENAASEPKGGTENEAEPTVDDETFTLHFRGKRCEFSIRSKLHFLLARQLCRARNRAIPLEKLSAWDGRRVAPETIRGAIWRLKRRLIDSGLGAVARMISCTTSFPDAHARLDRNKSN